MADAVGFDEFRMLRDDLHVVLAREAANRTAPDWVLRERKALTAAANEWALAHNRPPITTTEVEQVEQLAIGHSDYGHKLPLYVAELVTGRRVHP